MTDPLVVAGVAAAGAASLSALVVAWQAFETRRAANAAVASLDLTRSAQGAAEQSLAAAVQLASEAARSPPLHDTDLTAVLRATAGRLATSSGLLCVIIGTWAACRLHPAGEPVRRLGYG